MIIHIRKKTWNHFEVQGHANWLTLCSHCPFCRHRTMQLLTREWLDPMSILTPSHCTKLLNTLTGTYHADSTKTLMWISTGNRARHRAKTSFQKRFPPCLWMTSLGFAYFRSALTVLFWSASACFARLCVALLHFAGLSVALFIGLDLALHVLA